MSLGFNRIKKTHAFSEQEARGEPAFPPVNPWSLPGHYPFFLLIADLGLTNSRYSEKAADLLGWQSWSYWQPQHRWPEESA